MLIFTQPQVTLSVSRATNTVVFNSLGLKITRAAVGSLESESIELNEKQETATVHFPSEIGKPGEKVCLMPDRD